MAKRRVYSNPIMSRTVEMLISSALVYLFTPKLQAALAPLQAQLNANALNKGQTPPNQGLSVIANKLVAISPSENPSSIDPVTLSTPVGETPLTATGPFQSPAS